MARAKKPEETSATTTEETTAETVEAIQPSATNDSIQADFVNTVNESVAAEAAAAPDLAGIQVSKIQIVEEAPAAEPTIETTPAAFPLSSVDSAFATREAEAPASSSPTPLESYEQPEEAPEPLSDRAVEKSWIPTHRIVTDTMTCLAMVVGPYAWTHPEWDSGKGSPLLSRDAANGSWLSWKCLDGSELSGKVVSLDPPASDRHTHRREPVTS